MIKKIIYCDLCDDEMQLYGNIFKTKLQEVDVCNKCVASFKYTLRLVALGITIKKDSDIKNINYYIVEY